jgi:hypothetical protein
MTIRPHRSGAAALGWKALSPPGACVLPPMTRRTATGGSDQQMFGASNKCGTGAESTKKRETATNADPRMAVGQRIPRFDGMPSR